MLNTNQIILTRLHVAQFELSHQTLCLFRRPISNGGAICTFLCRAVHHASDPITKSGSSRNSRDICYCMVCVINFIWYDLDISGISSGYHIHIHRRCPTVVFLSSPTMTGSHAPWPQQGRPPTCRTGWLQCLPLKNQPGIDSSVVEQVKIIKAIIILNWL